MAIKNNMRPNEVLSGKSGDVYATINGKRFHFMQITEIEATLEYEKGDVPMLGRRMTGHKINGCNGSYKGKGYYMFDELRLMAEEYKNGGAAPVYDIEITNVEEGTLAGVHRAWLKDCMPDSDVIAKADAGSEFLEEDVEGTFDDFSIEESFNSDMPGYAEE